jgi:hypothetical protein
MSTKCYAQVRGSVIRVTRLDACGVPVEGATSTAVSKRISTITLDKVAESGNDIREKNFGDELCIVDDGYESLIGYSADVNLCGVDPDLVSMFTGQPTVANAAGDIVGFDVETGIDLDGFGFSLEMWTKIAGGACDASGNRPWGYTVFPFLKGGTLGGFSIENGAVQFSITGARTRDGNAWGAGPYDVDLSAGVGPDFTAGPLFTPLETNTAYRNILVYLDPPVASCGAFALPAA